jgi:hypothetical protein
MSDCFNWFSVSDVKFRSFKRSSVILDGFLLDDAAGGRVSEPGRFSLRVVVPSDARVE